MEKIKARVTAMVDAMTFASHRAKKREFARLYAIFMERKEAKDKEYQAKNDIPDMAKTVTYDPSAKHEEASTVKCRASATSFAYKQALLQPARDTYHREHALFKGAINTKCKAVIVAYGKDAVARREKVQAQKELLYKQASDVGLQKRLAKLYKVD